ncbi:MAG: type II toxin-antitoxin system VapC family toxin [Bryobacterales bacterium]|nr:type II toxin-antitoxin system VapC family toxin [Bryobacterales bacterium]
MAPSILLDTHILVRWLSAPKLLSAEQRRVLERAIRHREQVAVSAISLMEFAILAGDGKLRLRKPLGQVLSGLQADSMIEVLPITYEIALEAAYLGVLRDPADRAIVATARAHGLRLLTSDQRIVGSNLVSIVD